MILRYMKHSANICLIAHDALSRSIVDGVADFFEDRYGKKDFTMPPGDLKRYLLQHAPETICFFVHDTELAGEAERFVRELIKRHPDIRILVILPNADRIRWEQLLNPSDIATFSRRENGAIRATDAFRILRFLSQRSWDCLLTASPVPRWGAVWGKDVIRMDFSRKRPIAIERLNSKAFFRMPLITISYLFQALVYPPSPKNTSSLSSVSRRNKLP